MYARLNRRSLIRVVKNVWGLSGQNTSRPLGVGGSAPTSPKTPGHMAKRFTDTEKWKKEWFRKLPVKMKAVWEYLRDNCDHAGLWSADWGLLEFQIGELVTAQECVSSFGSERFIRLRDGKFFLPSFIEFQYGELSATNNTHRSVLNLLKKAGVDQPLRSPCPGVQDTGTDTDTGLDKDKDKDKEVLAAPRPKSDVSTDEIESCKQAWRETLRKFKQERNLIPGEELMIVRAIREHGVEAVELALFGAAFEPGFEGWKPEGHVNMARVLLPDKTSREPRIQKFVGYGAKERSKQSGRTLKQLADLMMPDYIAPEPDPEAEAQALQIREEIKQKAKMRGVKL